jgi:hypothetical protein
MQPVTNDLGSDTYGRGTTYTVGGARPEGQATLLDGTDVQGFYARGSGLNTLGTSLACIIREDTTEGVSGDMRSPKSLLSA